MAQGKRRSVLMDAFDDLLHALDNRVIPFDSAAARHSADLMAARQKKGRPDDLRDTMIAGIVLAQHATLATRNVSHFQGIPVIDPWKG